MKEMNKYLLKNIEANKQGAHVCVCVHVFNQSFNFPWFFWSKVVQIVIHLYICKGMPVSIFCHFQFRSTLLFCASLKLIEWIPESPLCVCLFCVSENNGNKQISIFHFDTMQYFSFIWNIINRLRSLLRYLPITCLFGGTSGWIKNKTHSRHDECRRFDQEVPT